MKERIFGAVTVVLAISALVALSSSPVAAQPDSSNETSIEIDDDVEWECENSYESDTPHPSETCVLVPSEGDDVPLSTECVSEISMELLVIASGYPGGTITVEDSDDIAVITSACDELIWGE